ncbi:MAG: non-canonical purine NTP pyrophosphatase [Gemmatimonadota bacterium]
MSRVLLATRSSHKAAEIQRIVPATRRFELITLHDLQVPETADEETIENAPTFLANATAKALYFARRFALPTIADDSGLEVSALGNAPGVRTRRFAIDHGHIGLAGAELDEANNRLLLDRMHGIAQKQRAARYVCAAAFALDPQNVLQAIGTCRGEVALEPQGVGGFGYDPIFLLPDLGVTFAQLSPDQKNTRSHRARAFRALAVLLPASVDPKPRHG